METVCGLIVAFGKVPLTFLLAGIGLFLACYWVGTDNELGWLLISLLCVVLLFALISQC